MTNEFNEQSEDIVEFKMCLHSNRVQKIIVKTIDLDNVTQSVFNWAFRRSLILCSSCLGLGLEHKGHNGQERFLLVSSSCSAASFSAAISSGVFFRRFSPAGPISSSGSSLISSFFLIPYWKGIDRLHRPNYNDTPNYIVSIGAECVQHTVRKFQHFPVFNRAYDKNVKSHI